MDIVPELEKLLLPGFKKVAAEITEQFPDVKATVWSGSLGSATDSPGHHLGIDCLLTQADRAQADNLALYVGVYGLRTTPALEAEVCWGHPSGHIEAELFPDPVEITPETLEELEAGLPRLYEALKAAVSRGHPVEEP